MRGGSGGGGEEEKEVPFEVHTLSVVPFHNCLKLLLVSDRKPQDFISVIFSCLLESWVRRSFPSHC